MALTITPKTHTFFCPDFSLPTTAGGTVTKKSLLNGKPFLVMFICNHCPYVKAIEDRLITLGNDLESIGVRVLAVSSNDASEHPEDSFSEMKNRATAKGYPFPYAYDESQVVARAFGAVCTPDFFLFDLEGKLSYRGRLDDSWKDPQKVTKRELFEAAKALLEQKPLNFSEVPSMGCSIKWRSK